MTAGDSRGTAPCRRQKRFSGVKGAKKISGAAILFSHKAFARSLQLAGRAEGEFAEK